MARGDHQRRHALLVLGVNLRSGVEQQFSRFDLVLRGGEMQRGVAQRVDEDLALRSL